MATQSAITDGCWKNRIGFIVRLVAGVLLMTCGARRGSPGFTSITTARTETHAADGDFLDAVPG
jgi:hypothetical protein